MLKITRKENSFEIYLSLSCAQLVCVHSHLSLLGGVGVIKMEGSSAFLSMRKCILQCPLSFNENNS